MNAGAAVLERPAFLPLDGASARPSFESLSAMEMWVMTELARGRPVPVTQVPAETLVARLLTKRFVVADADRPGGYRMPVALRRQWLAWARQGAAAGEA